MVSSVLDQRKIKLSLAAKHSWRRVIFVPMETGWNYLWAEVSSLRIYIFMADQGRTALRISGIGEHQRSQKILNGSIL